MSDAYEGLVIAVVGPTATGKSDLGIELAHRLGGEVINADASQLYRGMDIGTAKVPVAERQGVPHHLLDVLEVTDEANVAAYQRDARAAIDAVTSRGRAPIVVGGSGLYVRAALDRLEIPPTDPDARARWERELEAVGAAALHDRLARADPKAAEGIQAGNGRRIVRALEVIELTGRPYSATMPQREFLRPSVMVGLRCDRAILAERAAHRVERMWSAGLLTEVEGLIPKGLRRGRTASRAIGYAQALAEIDGTLSTEQAKELTVVATRRLIRRQEAWFRPDPRIRWIDIADGSSVVERAIAEIESPSATMEG